MVNEPGYFTEASQPTAQHSQNLMASLDLMEKSNTDKEDLNELNETLKDISEAPYLQQMSQLKPESLNKPSYSHEKFQKNDLEKKGTVTIENATYKDKLTHGEFVEFLKLLFNSQHILLGDNLSKSEERMKKKLCNMLIILNWGPRDNWTQARLHRSMEDRVYSVASTFM